MPRSLFDAPPRKKGKVFKKVDDVDFKQEPATKDYVTVMDSLFKIESIYATEDSSYRNIRKATQEQIDNKDFKIIKKYNPNIDLYGELTKKDKDSNFFIINKRLAIGMPLQAFSLSHLSINKEDAMDYWYGKTQKLAAKNGGFPKWIYTSTKSNNKKKVASLSKSVAFAKDFYIDQNQITENDFHLAMEFCSKEMNLYLKQLAKFLKELK